MLKMVEGYCSHCFKLSTHTLEEQNYLRRNVYKCMSCKEHTVQCRRCKNMARTSKKWDSEFCAEHDGTIANFDTLDDKLEELTDYPALFRRKDLNYVKAGKIAGVALLGAAVVGPAALIAGPAIGGAVGVKILGYSGAVATKAGLAALGGGSLASGGAGMAGGMAVITATGTALGGTLGGVVSNSYFGEIEGFFIEQIQEGRGPSVIVIDGFLTQRKENPDDWLEAIRKIYPRNPCYYVRWESKRLAQIGNAVTLQIGKNGVAGALKGWTLSASKVAGSKLSPLTWTATIGGLASNPWSVAMIKAEMAGVLLADILSRTSSKYILCGHSLGARVAHYTLQSLATKGTKPRVVDAHLMGGAVGNKRSDWLSASKAVSGKIYNYHSNKDEVLKYLYSAGTVFQSKPIGRYAISTMPKVENHDVSSFVAGHSLYKENFASFVQGTDSVAKPAQKTASKKAAKKATKKTVSAPPKKATKKAVKKVAKKAAKKAAKKVTNKVTKQATKKVAKKAVKKASSSTKKATKKTARTSRVMADAPKPLM